MAPTENGARQVVLFRALALALCALGWGLRLFRIGRQSLWYDEALSVSQAAEPLRRLVIDLAQTDVHPPLYFSLLHGWMLAAGSSEPAVRSLSAWCSTLTIAAVIVLGTRLAGRRVGLLAGCLGCASPLLVYYGQETRMYALLALLSTLAGYAFLRAAGGRRRWWPAYVLLMAAALWTQLYAALLFAALNVWYVADAAQRRLHGGRAGDQADPRRRPAPWLLAQVGVVLLFAAWLPIAWHSLRTYTSPGHGSALGWLLEQTAIVFTQGYPAAGPATLPGPFAGLPAEQAALALIVPSLAALAAGLPALHGRRLFAACWLVLPIGGIFLLSLGKRDFNARYLMEAAPAFLMLVAAGIAWTWQRRRPFGGLLGLAVAAASLFTLLRIYTDPAYARDDNRAAVERIAQSARPGAGVVLDAAYFEPAFDYYARGRWPLINLPIGHPAEAARTAAALATFTAGRPQVWLLLWQDYYADPDELVWHWLLQHFYAASWSDIHGGLKVLSFDALPPAGLRRSGATLGGAVQLVGSRITAGRDGPAARQLDLDLYWQTLARPAANDTIAAYLVDAGGTVVAAASTQPADFHLPMSTWQRDEHYHTTTRLPLPDALAAGQYRLLLVLTDPDTQAELPAAGRDAAGPGFLLPVLLPQPAASAPARQRAPVIASAVPPPVHPVAADFSGIGRLSGYQLSSAKGGVVLTLFWQATAATRSPFKVFVHALDAQGRVIASGDGDPAGGVAPTTTWFADEVIRDPHRLHLPADVDVAAYEVGLYDPRSGRRVSVRLADGSTPPDEALRLPGGR